LLDGILVLVIVLDGRERDNVVGWIMLLVVFYLCPIIFLVGYLGWGNPVREFVTFIFDVYIFGLMDFGYLLNFYKLTLFDEEARL
jgi:hypothetical protein